MSQDALASEAGNPPSDHWWIPIATLAVLGPILVVIGVATPPDAYASLLGAPFALLGIVLTILSPLFVHFDRRYVRTVSSWEPSGWYYWMIVPLFNVILPIAYIYQRHRYVATP